MNELIPQMNDFTVLKEVAHMALKSGFLPTSIKTIEQAVIIALKGRELGLPPMNSFAGISVINGRPAISSELMLSLIYRKYPRADISFKETNDKQCVIDATREGGKPNQFIFTMDDARRAGLCNKTPWVQYPAAMLRARCISAMARALFPECLMGASYTPEELEGIKSEERAKPVEKEVISFVAPVVCPPTPSIPQDAIPLPKDTGDATETLGLPPGRFSEPPQVWDKPSRPEPLRPDLGPAFRKPTEKQLKRLYAITKTFKWEPEDVKAYMKARFSIGSSKELNMDTYEVLCNVIQQLSPYKALEEISSPQTWERAAVPPQAGPTADAWEESSDGDKAL